MSWAAVKGHEKLVASFQNVIRRGRLAHAYLFVGPPGVGKKRFAVELAKTMLCEDPAASVRLEACDQCSACVQIAALTHPDYQQIGIPEDKHEFPIDLMQDLISHLALKPARGKHRAAIVDDADTFNDETANCFLKSLEEPPPMSLLILIGTNPDRQLPTIRSRCQLIRFAGLPEEVMAAHLVQEGVAPALDAARQLLQLSSRNLADARLLADPATRTFRREFLDGLSQPNADSVGLGQKLVKFADEGVKESAVKRQRAALALKFVIDFLRAAILTQNGGQPPLADPQDAKAVRRLAESVPPDALLRMLDRSLEADYQVGRRLQLVLILEALTDALGQAA
jgi:DNA polymerase-3 subunit delta'